jgi:hypothetical protein
MLEKIAKGMRWYASEKCKYFGDKFAYLVTGVDERLDAWNKILEAEYGYTV